MIVALSCTMRYGCDPGAERIPAPPVTHDGWATSSLEDAGINPEHMRALKFQRVAAADGGNSRGFHSLLIAKGGKLVFEEYAPAEMSLWKEGAGDTGDGIDRLQSFSSATESVLAALTGIALQRGYLNSIDDKVYDFFPEYSDLAARCPAKCTMTIRHLLTMTSGLEWDDGAYPFEELEGTSNSRERTDEESEGVFGKSLFMLLHAAGKDDPERGCAVAVRGSDIRWMSESLDPLRYVLDKPLFAEPGAVFEYDNCNAIILMEILRRVCGTTVEQFAEEALLRPLEITRSKWRVQCENANASPAVLYLRPRDMLKIGLLFLNKGVWHGEQVIPRPWCELATSRFVNFGAAPGDFPEASGYGLFWWQSTMRTAHESFVCQIVYGWGGQYLILVPSMDAVLLFTGCGREDSGGPSPFDLFAHLALPAMLGHAVENSIP